MPTDGDPQDQVRSVIDTSVAHEARVYDYWLGGKDNYAVDRELGDAIAAQIPTIRTMARANRDFLGRAVGYLVREAGVRQFLDIGTGIPTADNVHEVAQRITPDVRVVYVDNDPIVLAHARALMTSDPAGKTEYIQADLHDPAAILDNPVLWRTLDPSRPVALMLVAVMMYFPDSDNPYGIVRTLLDALPSGSYVTITHPTADFDPDAMAGVVAATEHAGITFIPRSHAETARFFDGLDVVDPGVVPVLAWRPDSEPTATPSGQPPGPAKPRPDPASAYYWAGIARKP